MKNKILLTILVMISLFIITGCGCENKEVQEKYNTNENIIKTREIEELQFTNTSLKVSPNQSTLVTLISNPTKEDKNIKRFDIHVKDKDGNLIVTLQGYFGGVIPAGESRKVTASVNLDLSNATDIEYETIK